MTRSTLSYLQLLALLVTATQRATSSPCDFVLSPHILEKVPHLQEDIRLLHQAVCDNDQKMAQYTQDVDELIEEILSRRSLTSSRTKQDFEEEKKLMAQLFDRAYNESLTSGRRPAGMEVSPKGEIFINGPKMLKAETAINSYTTCVNKYERQSRVINVQKYLYDGITSGTVETVEKLQGYRARIISAGRADFAAMHARRMQCFMDTINKENALGEASLTKSSTEITKLEWAESRKEQEDGYKIIKSNLIQEMSELPEWRTRQTEVVRHVFDDLMKRKSQKEVLESQENRINALQVMAEIEKEDAQRAKKLFNIEINYAKNLHAKVWEMMKDYLKCAGCCSVHAEQPQPQWSSDIFTELTLEMFLFSQNTRPDRSTFEYFWRKHFIGIILDIANAMQASLDCFERMERKYFYEK